MYFIGNFDHLTDQQQTEEKDRRHGAFSMMVEAASAKDALEAFRSRLTAFRKSSELFSGRCIIYINQLIEFKQFPNNEAVLMNLKSFAGDPVMPYISCVVPTEQSNACQIHEWNDNQPETSGRTDSVFLEFDE